MHVRGLLSLHLPPKPRSGGHAGSKRPWQAGAEESAEDEDGEDAERRREQPAKKKPAIARREDGSIVKTVPVVCNSTPGDFVVATQRVRCRHVPALAFCPSTACFSKPGAATMSVTAAARSWSLLQGICKPCFGFMPSRRGTCTQVLRMPSPAPGGPRDERDAVRGPRRLRVREEVEDIAARGAGDVSGSAARRAACHTPAAVCSLTILPRPYSHGVFAVLRCNVFGSEAAHLRAAALDQAHSRTKHAAQRLLCREHLVESAGRAAITIGKWMDIMGLDRPVRAPRPANSDNAASDEEWGITTRRAKRQSEAGRRQVLARCPAARLPSCLAAKPQEVVHVARPTLGRVSNVSPSSPLSSMATSGGSATAAVQRMAEDNWKHVNI